jgi:hypothetical protein
MAYADLTGSFDPARLPDTAPLDTAPLDTGLPDARLSDARPLDAAWLN